MHTTPPPELVIPTKYDPRWIRGDFTGVTLTGTYTPTASADVIANGGVTMTSGPWNGLFVPFLPGANSTPPTMIMTPMLVMYPRKVQDAVLTEHAWRNYSHLIWDTLPWNAAANGFSLSPQAAQAWASYLKSWGFYSSVWMGIPSATDPMWAALVNSKGIDYAVIGEEVDGKFTAQQYGAMLNSLRAGPLGGIPCGTHLTSNFPDGFPRDTFFDGTSMPGFDHYDGWLDLCWQADQTQSAGTQGAMLYYARQRVNLGGVGGNGSPAPNSRVNVWEIMASAQLMGQCTEEYGCLRSLELLYCPADNPAIRAISGGGNGLGRYPNGMPI